MAIKNYTTKVDVGTSLGEIQEALAKHGAVKIMAEYDNGVPVAISFAINGPRGLRGFTLPSPVEGTIRAFAEQRIKPTKQQAEMTAWRNVRDWILAQMALIESCDVPVDQVFLPYLSDGKGNTVYSIYESGQLLLGPKEEQS